MRLRFSVTTVEAIRLTEADVRHLGAGWQKTKFRLRGPEPHDLVRRHERPLDVIHTRVHVRHHRRESGAREIEAGLLHGGRTGHLGKQLRSLNLVWCESNANVAI